MSNISISQFLSLNISKFESEDKVSVRSDLQAILCEELGIDRAYLYLNSSDNIDQKYIVNLNEKVLRLLRGEPLAYILGYKYFWDQKLYVTQDTLIPRADTEVLVESVLDDVLDKNAELNILDLGTGSGAIALALAGELPNSNIVAVDFSLKALNIAKNNALENNICNVEFIQSDWYESLIAESFDIIVSNPPYIDFADTNIDQEVKAFEPESALFSKDDGLADIKIIVSEAKNFLSSNGRVYIEHGFSQSENVKAILRENQFIQIQTIKDLNKKDRCTKAIYSM